MADVMGGAVAAFEAATLNMVLRTLATLRELERRVTEPALLAKVAAFKAKLEAFLADAPATGLSPLDSRTAMVEPIVVAMPHQPQPIPRNVLEMLAARGVESINATRTQASSFLAGIQAQCEAAASWQPEPAPDPMKSTRVRWKREDDIKAMEAGPELDALVAEHVMGESEDSPPPYSTDLEAAWWVVHRMDGKPYTFSVGANYCDVYEERQQVEGVCGGTMPLSVCRAALLVALRCEGAKPWNPPPVAATPEQPPPVFTPVWLSDVPAQPLPGVPAALAGGALDRVMDAGIAEMGKAIDRQMTGADVQPDAARQSE